MINFEQIINKTVEEGAFVVPGIFSRQEIETVPAGGVSWEILQITSKKIARFITGLSACLPDSIHVNIDYESLVPMNSLDMHEDPNPNGLSILIPLSGPEADFYYADDFYDLPEQLDKVKSFRYGVSDAAIIRQKVTKNGVEYDQTVHCGNAPRERRIMTCDLWQRQPVNLDLT